MIRLFIALPLPPSPVEHLAGLIERLREQGGAVKWVKPENIHITVRFLGDTDEAQVPQIKAALNEIAPRYDVIDTTIFRLGGFPNLNRPRVIWAGMDGSVEAMQKMARQIEHAMRDLGFEKDKKSFKPHLTLGRVRDPGGLEALSGFMKDLRFDDIPMTLDRLVLFQSTLTPRGPIYDRLHEAPLAQDTFGG